MLEENGTDSTFTKGLLNALFENYDITPWDWQVLAKMALDASPCLLWRAGHDGSVNSRLTKTI